MHTFTETDGALQTFLLSLCYGAYFFLINLLPYQGGTISRNVLWNIYLSGCVTIVPLTLIASYATHYAQRRYFNDGGLLFSILLTISGLFWAAAAWGLRRGAAPPALVAALYPLSILTGLALAAVAARCAGNIHARHTAAVSALFLFPLLAGAALLAFWPGTGAWRRETFFIAGAALLSVFHFSFVNVTFSARWGRALDAAVLLLMALFVFDPQFHFDHGHHNFYLGPTHDFLAGKTMLVDINFAYGVLPVYVLGAVFMSGIVPVSYQGLSCSLSLLSIAQYAVLYFLMKRLIGSRLISIAGLILIVMINHFSTVLYSSCFPSVGPLRFGIVYLLLAAVAIRLSISRGRRFMRAMEYSIVGLSSIWSMETFFFTAAAYCAVLVYDSIAESSTMRKSLAKSASRMGLAGIFVLIANVLLALHIRLRAGVWPDWWLYLDYILPNAAGGLGAYPISPWSPWFIIVAVYFASLIALWQYVTRTPPGKRDPILAIVAGMTFFGIAQFTYFLQRAHPNNLFHVCVPAIVVALYWIVASARKSLPRAFSISFYYCCYFTAAVLFISALSRVIEKRESTAIYSLAVSSSQILAGRRPLIAEQYRNLREKRPSGETVGEAISLIGKYARSQSRIALFMSPDLNTETLVLSGKSHVFPLSHPEQDYEFGIATTAIRHALTFHHPLKNGDFIFVDGMRGNLNPLQRKILARLEREFRFEEVETSPHGIVAIRLRPL